MNFTFKIEYQNKQERSITVSYIPENTKALPVVYVLSYPEGATELDIKNIALAHAPIRKWEDAITREDADFPLGEFEATTEEVNVAVAIYSPPPSLEEIKIQRRSEIDRWREAAEQAGMPWKFGDVEDRVQVRHDRDLNNINGRVSAALVLKGRGVTEPVLPFRAESDTTHHLTPDHMIDMGLAVGDFTATQYMIAWGLKERLDQAQTEEDVEAITWPTL